MPDRNPIRRRLGAPWRALVGAALLVCAAVPSAGAAEKGFLLFVEGALADSGALGFLLPRFALKTGVRPELTTRAEADMRIVARTGEEEEGDPVIAHESGAVYVAIVREDGAGAMAAERFREWLLSAVGRGTIAAFETGGRNPLRPPEVEVAAAPVEAPEGDVDFGAEVALVKCGRCHVIDGRNRFGGIGSTPSFGALRALSGWRDRFAAFWTLNPHPSFTQIEDVTEPFDPARPPPIAPMRLTLDEVEAIGAFVAGMAPKDLGAPIAHQ